MGLMPITISCSICQTAFTVIPSRAKTAKYCSYACHQTGEGRKGGLVRGEQLKKLSLGQAYTKTRGRHTHRVVMEAILGRKLRRSEVVHHKDGNILNNHPDNLELLSSQGEHMNRHRATLLAARKGKHGY